MKDKIKRIIYSETYGWHAWEVIWLAVSCAAIVLFAAAGGDGAAGIISAVTGTAYVVCNGKGKLCAYVFGLVNSVLYAVISFKSALYGETMLNALYYVPMQFIGFYTWSKHMDKTTKEVKKKRMNISQRMLTAAAIAAGTVGYGLILRTLNDTMPFIDAFTTVASVIALAASVGMYAEQWYIWIAVDVVTVYMWFRVFSGSGENAATLVMWIIYVITGIAMLVKWEKEARVGESDTEVRW